MKASIHREAINWCFISIMIRKDNVFYASLIISHLSVRAHGVNGLIVRNDDDDTCRIKRVNWLHLIWSYHSRKRPSLFTVHIDDSFDMYIHIWMNDEKERKEEQRDKWTEGEDCYRNTFVHVGVKVEERVLALSGLLDWFQWNYLKRQRNSSHTSVSYKIVICSYYYGRWNISTSWYWLIFFIHQKSLLFFLFFSIDLNKDQRLDINEFRNLLAQSLGISGSVFASSVVDGGQYSTGSFESASNAYVDLNAGAGGYENVSGVATTTLNGTGNVGGNASYSSYEQTSYSTSPGGVSGGFEGATVVEGDASNAAAAGATAGASSSSTFETTTTTTQQQVQQYATSPEGLFQDPNPQIIRRPAQGGQITYTQNVKIRFLQPPAIPPPGVCYSFALYPILINLFNFSHWL